MRRALALGLPVPRAPGIASPVVSSPVISSPVISSPVISSPVVSSNKLGGAGGNNDAGDGEAGFGGTSRAELFREIAHLNREVKRLQAENRELAHGDARVQASAALATVQAQCAELAATLDDVRERCTCGAARVHHRKK